MKRKVDKKRKGNKTKDKNRKGKKKTLQKK